MAALNTTTFSYALKKRYSEKKVEDLALKAANSPLYGMVPKMRNFGGSNFTEAVRYANVKGRSKTFSNAQANKAGASGVAFVNSRVKDYALCSIDTETILASKGLENSLLEAAKNEVESAINVLGKQIAIDLYRDGSGALGTISAISSGVITLTNAADAANFEVGQVLVAAADTSSAPRAATGTITAMDPTHATDHITVNSGASPAAWAAADELFAEGDYVSASDRKAINGLDAWIPSSVTGLGTAFNGVTRSTDAMRLAGHRVDGSGKRIDEGLF